MFKVFGLLGSWKEPVADLFSERYFTELPYCIYTQAKGYLPFVRLYMLYQTEHKFRAR